MFSWNVGKPPGLPQFHLPDFAVVSTQLFFSYMASRFMKICPFRISSSISLNTRRQLIAKRLLNIKAVLSCRKRGEQWNRSYYVEMNTDGKSSRFFVLYKIFFSCQLYRTKDIFSKEYITLHRKVSFVWMYCCTEFEHSLPLLTMVWTLSICILLSLFYR